MVRTTISYLIIVILLLMNTQTAIGFVNETLHMHDSMPSFSVDAHASDASHETEVHCEHCCHAHASAIVANENVAFSCLSYELNSYNTFIYGCSHSGPATPPPNA